MPIRFHLDEHISAHVASGLRRRHIDVTTSAEAGLIGAPDIVQLQFAHTSGRVQQQSMSIGELLRRLILIHNPLAPEEISGEIEFL